MLHEPDTYVHELHRYALSVARTVAFGKRVTSRSSDFAAQLRDIMENFSRLPRFMQPWIGELEKYRDHETEFPLRCYRDAIQMRKAGLEDEIEASTSCMEILGAGSETTATTLHFTILALLTHPKVVKKAHQELDRVIGQDRFPTWEDEPNLPYIRAIIKENQRWRSISPLSFPHYTSKEDVYNGYYIPQNCVVRISHCIPDLQIPRSMHHHDAQYPSPEQFDPDRFFDYKLSAAASANLADATQRDHYSYGGGKRICPGIHSAERSLFIMTSRMIQAFDFYPPLDPETGLPRYVTLEHVGVSTGLIMSPGADFKTEEW
ncbi:hypothetical protein Neosp_009074 [[Neocosmospora] mangrovei]